jgi:hypothetical protein
VTTSLNSDDTKTTDDVSNTPSSCSCCRPNQRSYSVSGDPLIPLRHPKQDPLVDPSGLGMPLHFNNILNRHYTPLWLTVISKPPLIGYPSAACTFVSITVSINKKNICVVYTCKRGHCFCLESLHWLTLSVTLTENTGTRRNK